MGNSFAFEYELEDELRKVVDKLWVKHQVTGELNIIKLPDGKWHLEVHSEHDIRDSIINSFPGKRVKTRSISTSRIKSTDPDSDESDLLNHTDIEKSSDENDDDNDEE
jgi:hypothetical protein